MEQWVALPSHSSRVSGLNLGSSYCLCDVLHTLHICVDFLWVLRFAPTSQNHAGKQIGYAKLLLDVNACVLVAVR